MCNINNDIPVRIPSHLYVLVNRSALCNCAIEAGNHFLLESLAACQDSNSKLVMYFTMNAAFVNYLDQFTNMTKSLKIPIIRNKTTFEQTLPISIHMSTFDKQTMDSKNQSKNPARTEPWIPKEISDINSNIFHIYYPTFLSTPYHIRNGILAKIPGSQDPHCKKENSFAILTK